jgi:hypothetical protein
MTNLPNNLIKPSKNVTAKAAKFYAENAEKSSLKLCTIPFTLFPILSSLFPIRYSLIIIFLVSTLFPSSVSCKKYIPCLSPLRCRVISLQAA